MPTQQLNEKDESAAHISTPDKMNVSTTPILFVSRHSHSGALEKSSEFFNNHLINFELIFAMLHPPMMPVTTRTIIFGDPCLLYPSFGIGLLASGQLESEKIIIHEHPPEHIRQYLPCFHLLWNGHPLFWIYEKAHLPQFLSRVNYSSFFSSKTLLMGLCAPTPCDMDVGPCVAQWRVPRWPTKGDTWLRKRWMVWALMETKRVCEALEARWLVEVGVVTVVVDLNRINCKRS